MSAMAPSVFRIEDARTDFLDTLDAIAPNVLDDLLTSEALADPSHSTMTPSPALRRHVAAWQDRHHLTAPWIAEDAMVTLSVHAKGAPWRWSHMPGGSTVAFTDAIPNYAQPLPIVLPEHHEWRWEEESPAQAKARILAALAAEIDRQLADHVKTLPATAPNPKHHEWLVHYQVLGESRNDIAKAVGLDRTTIRDGIRDLAAMLELELRTATGGRPRKK